MQAKRYLQRMQRVGSAPRLSVPKRICLSDCIISRIPFSVMLPRRYSG